MPILSINQLHEIYLQCGLNYSSSASSRHRGIFRGFMGSLYVKGKENGHVQAYAPTGAMGLKLWGIALRASSTATSITSTPPLPGKSPSVTKIAWASNCTKVHKLYQSPLNLLTSCLEKPDYTFVNKSVLCFSYKRPLVLLYFMP